MAKDRSMAIKHAKAKQEAMKEVKNGQYDFSQTIWGLTETAKECFRRKPYEAYYPKRH